MTTSSSIPLAEAKNRLSELVDRTSRGEEFVITRHDAEVARLIPVKRPPRHDVSKAIIKMRAARARRKTSMAEIIAWKSEGRR